MAKNISLANSRSLLGSRGKYELAETKEGKKLIIAEANNKPVLAESVAEDLLFAKPDYQPTRDKVFSCDPSIGSFAPQGAKVTLVMVKSSGATFEFIPDKVHDGLKDQNIRKFFDNNIKDDEKAIQLITKYSAGKKLTEPEKEVMNAKFAAEGLTVSEDDESQGFDAAMKGYTAAVKFGLSL